MGIINLTPDSFYDGGRLKDSSDVLRQAEEMLTQGATFLDMGGYSSRPGASDVQSGEEIRRVIPAIRAVAGEFPEAIISVDTFRSEVAQAAVEDLTPVHEVGAVVSAVDRRYRMRIRAMIAPVKRVVHQAIAES